MLDVFGHANLSHEAILVSIHTCEVANVRENVLQTICQLESLDMTKTVLYMWVDDEFDHTENFSAKMERISKSTFLSLFGR